MRVPNLNWIVFLVAVSIGHLQSGRAGPSPLEMDETSWANRLGVKSAYVHALVDAAGYSDEDGVRIDNLDIRHLKAHHHVLLVVSSGNGHCLTLVVLEQKQSRIQSIWELSETPGGGGFCHNGAYSGDFKAYATANGTIVIDVPKDENGRQVLAGIKHLFYVWNGREYALVDRQHSNLR